MQGEEGAERTRVPPIEGHFDAVCTTFTSRQMQWLMHITNKVNEELECLLCPCVNAGGGPRRADKVGQDRRDVLDGVEHVTARMPCPTVSAGEETVVRWVVARGADVVQWCGPPGAETDLVGPGGHGREVARCADANARVCIGCENGTDGVEGLGVEE